MTVKELIEKLTAYADDLPVVILDESGEESKDITVVDIERADREDAEAVVILA